MEEAEGEWERHRELPLHIGLCELAKHWLAAAVSERQHFALRIESEVAKTTWTHSSEAATYLYLQLCASSLRTTGPNSSLCEPHSAVHMPCTAILASLARESRDACSTVATVVVQLLGSNKSRLASLVAV